MGTRQGLLERHQQEARERDASRSFISVWSKSLPGMVFNGALCTISVIVSNLSSLALSSFFVSILPTKRNLLTHLNTVLVFVMAALVNALVRLSRIISKSSLFNVISLFQCGCTLVSVTFQISASLAIVLQFILVWLSSLLQAVLVALSLTRIFLILKVNTKGSPGFDSF